MDTTSYILTLAIEHLIVKILVFCEIQRFEHQSYLLDLSVGYREAGA